MAITQYLKFGRMLLIISVASAFSYQSAIAATFTDGFETGDLSKSGDGFKWTGMGANPIVVTDFAKDSSASLRFKFPGTSNGDAWAETRYTLGGNYNDVWLKADIFIPSNYNCRGSDHNKGPFFLWSGTYGVTASNVAANFEHWCVKGDAYLTFNPGGSGGNFGHYITSFDTSDYLYSRGTKFVDRDRDLNKWHEWIIHVKPATTLTSKDALVEVWKNGIPVWYRYDLEFHGKDDNYFDQGYIMGYSNSGFDEDTYIYYDNFVFSTERIDTNVKAPKPLTFMAVD